MNPDFLIPFILLCISLSWLNSAKSASEGEFDSVYFFQTGFFYILMLLLALCILAGIIIAWVNAGFLIALAYFGIAIGSFLVSSATVNIILIAIFGYSGLGAIAPLLASIASAIYMFTKVGTF